MKCAHLYVYLLYLESGAHALRVQCFYARYGENKMTKRMLIDATHKEEIRVAITKGNRLAEYEYESLSRKPLKGSIFLAKVTRVEPSLQAAFVNFGGNRHGFLPFSEIHPDYFRIPVADREALMAEQEAFLKEHDDEVEQALKEDAQDVDVEEGASVDEVEEPDEVGGLGSHEEDESDDSAQDDPSKKELDTEDAEEAVKVADKEDVAAEGSGEDSGEDSEKDANDQNNKKGARRRNPRGRGRRGRSSRSMPYRNRNVEVVGGEDIDNERRFRFNLRRKYKIQEVIKRGQIMLIQANKEERGNKGAAVGTYLSLPGRYCVLMPNSPRAGGVSRKIANHRDRARMRDIVKSLDVPKGMSVIVRTAGVSRNKTEIKRDLDYLMRLWDNIRELTLESTAPSLVYEEADLIKRAVRDLYTRDVEEVFVSGDEGHKTAKSFMKMMIPSHAKKVVKYEDKQLPLFNRYQIESQISEIGIPEVHLKAGGYLVINPTEALVSVDVNSGKATKGRHIEETALKTNLEAADEVARQLKLRDLGGLVVIDFIDMEDRRNNGKVERRMKEALSSDRARVQVGRISSFGLMELSRQRLSSSLTEAQYKKCPHCNGVGVIPSADAMSIMVLRAIEEEGIRARAAQVIVRVNSEVALYLLNHKRKKLMDIEERYSFEVLLRVDDTIPACEHCLEVSKPAEKNGLAKKENEEESSLDQEEGQDPAKASSRGRRTPRGRGRTRTRPSSPKTEEIGNKDVQNVQAPKDVVETVSEELEPKISKPKRVRRKPVKKADEDTAKTENEVPKKRRTTRKKETLDSKDSEIIKKVETPEKTPEKEIVKKEAPKKEASKKVPAAKIEKNEVVNKPPKEKKKGWWNKLVE